VFRTMLFSPGNNPKRMKKALDLPADAIIFDLEDAVAVTEKESARNIITEVLSQTPERNYCPNQCSGYALCSW